MNQSTFARRDQEVKSESLSPLIAVAFICLDIEPKTSQDMLGEAG